MHRPASRVGNWCVAVSACGCWRREFDMREPRISRRRLVGAGAVGAIGVLLAPEAVLAEGDDREEVDLLRWDLVQIVQATVLSGGTDVGSDAATGDKVRLTGSGEARPEKRKATGGGTFVHLHKDGTEEGHGVYVVTGFKSFVNGGGSLVGTGLTDGIDELKNTTGGVLTLNVHAKATSGASADAVLEVHCSLPGGKADTEGIRLTVGPLKFVQAGGPSLGPRLNNE